MRIEIATTAERYADQLRGQQPNGNEAKRQVDSPEAFIRWKCIRIQVFSGYGSGSRFLKMIVNIST